jgi:ribosomal protein S18 acetylase RimI-like enzyme
MTAFLDEAALDNPVWSSLALRHARCAQGAGLALRYRSDFSPLSAMSAAAPENVEAMRALVRIDEAIVMAGPHLPDTLPGWDVVQRLRLAQMIRRDRTRLPENLDAISTLSTADVDDMLALVEITRPGPFCVRTVELGHFVGIRQHGRLVAMAGERLWVGDHREVSGVCTHPDAQGKGYSRTLLGHVINGMLGAGQTPFLHVECGNTRAIAVYESLGFVRRAEIPAAVVKRVA